MQLFGDGYEIPEMTKLHGLLRPSRFAQRSSGSRGDPAELRYCRSGGWPAAAEVSGYRWSLGDPSVGVFKVNAQIATQADPHEGRAGWPAGASAHVAPARSRPQAGCWGAHMCGTVAPAILKRTCRFDA